jgi:hypothetical protein
MKSKTTFIQKVLAVTLLLFLITSCKISSDFGEKGNGNSTTEKRAVTGQFEKIHVSSGIDVYVVQSNVSSVEVTVDENIQKLISTEVENGVLIVKSIGSFNSTDGVEVRVSLPAIMGLKASSGSSIKSNNVLNSKLLTVDSSSGSQIEINVETDFISLESSNGSSIEVIGKALKVETSSSSGSTIDADNLLANDIFAQASSGSSTTVNPILSLQSKASSGSSIHFKNIPKHLEKEESSGGSVSQD